MKKNIKSIIASVLLGTMILSGCGTAASNGSSESGKAEEASAYGTLFEKDTISEVNIDIAEDDWNALLADPTAQQFYSANITIDGETVNNVGFRTKGMSSLTTVAQSDSERYSFKIKFDKYVDGQSYNGLDEFVLNSNFADPSCMREYLTYEALEYLGADTPDTGYTKLYINGELYGLYLCVEALDDSFIEKAADGVSDDTCFYKAESEQCTLTSDSDVNGFELKYGNDTNNDNISKLITALNSMEDGSKGDIESILDVDSVLKAIAVNTVFGNYDSYSGSKAHNYYLLYNNGKFEYIAWDFNMAMGGFTEDSGASVTVDISEPIYNADAEDRPLITNLLAVPEYYEKYLEYINSLLEYCDSFETRVSEVASLIHDAVENDPTAFYTIDKFEENITASDTDLSTVTNQMGGGKGPMGNGDKDNETPDGSMPEMPDGGEMPDMPNMPQDGEKPDKPEGMDKQDGMQTPPNGDGSSQEGQPGDMQNPPQLPEGMENGKGPGMNGGGGGLISNNAVSIVDYVLQRAANIRSQLNL